MSGQNLSAVVKHVPLNKNVLTVKFLFTDGSKNVFFCDT